MANKTDNKDDTNYFSNLKYGRDEGVIQDVYVDTSDAYANYKQYMISFLHVPTNSTVYFKAYVTEYNENFTCSWTPTEVYGRTDPIQTYKGTKRTISLAFDVPAASMGEAYENLGRVSKLVQMLYPTYSPNDLGSGKIIGQAPLVRVKMMNLITKERAESPAYLREAKDEFDAPGALGQVKNYKDRIEAAMGLTNPRNLLDNYKTSPSPENGVLAAISSISYRSDLQKIQIFEKAANTVLPQSLTVTISFDVIHEETIGWTPTGNPMADSFPHKVTLTKSQYFAMNGKGVIGDDQNPRDISQRLADERDDQAEIDMKRAQKNRFLERLGVKALGRGLSSIGGGQMGPTMIDDDY